MNAQNFKGDATELKMQAVAKPLFDLTNSALNEFYENGFDCTPFLLMLYDEKRVPFSERIPRNAFVDFIKEALKQFPFTGTFESYLFVLRSIFGELTEVFFDVPAPGKLEIDIGAVANSEFEFIGREFVDGSYSFFNIVDHEGNLLIFRGIPGIDTEYELTLLLSEIIPVGIVPTISLQFFTRSDWIAEEIVEEESVFYNIVDHNNNQIVFYESGE